MWAIVGAEFEDDSWQGEAASIAEMKAVGRS